jgi:hypothetical protein
MVLAGFCDGAFLPALKREYESCRPNNVVSKTPDGRRFVMLPSQCGDLLGASGDWFCFECITFTAVSSHATTGASGSTDLFRTPSTWGSNSAELN